jgi:hypothetical protein
LREDFPRVSSPSTTTAPLWSLLIPATCLVHIVEEYAGGFPERFAEQLSLSGPANATFLLANGFFWLLMLGAAGLATRRTGWAWALPCLGTIIALNAVLHLSGALLTGSYSPGIVSGLLLWFPLGIAALSWGRRNLSTRKFRRGIILGVVAHVMAPVVGLGVHSLLLWLRAA